jgi:hypothetical protein
LGSGRASRESGPSHITEITPPYALLVEFCHAKSKPHAGEWGTSCGLDPLRKLKLSARTNQINTFTFYRMIGRTPPLGTATGSLGNLHAATPPTVYSLRGREWWSRLYRIKVHDGDQIQLLTFPPCSPPNPIPIQSIGDRHSEDPPPCGVSFFRDLLDRDIRSECCDRRRNRIFLP